MEYQLYINGEWKNTVTGYISQDKNAADEKEQILLKAADWMQ